MKEGAGQNAETVHFINWDEPEENDFSIAEEVTLKGTHERRPDLVLYVNGISVAVIELKNSRVSIGDGIRQLISNQQPEFNAWFFTTTQLLFSGNDSEGLRYGTTLTPEKYYLTWKEDEDDNEGFKLDKYLKKMCRKARLIELIHDFIHLRWRGQKGSPCPPILRHEKGSKSCHRTQRWYHLAYSGIRDRQMTGWKPILLFWVLDSCFLILLPLADQG